MIENLETLLIENMGLLKGYALKLTHSKYNSDDLTQDTIVRIIEKQNLWNPEFKFSSWCICIMKNIWINKLRAEKLRNTNDLDDEYSKEFYNQDDNNLESMINKNLSETLNKTFWLWYSGYSYQEIAELQKIKIGTVRSRINMARGILKKKISLESN